MNSDSYRVVSTSYTEQEHGGMWSVCGVANVRQTLKPSSRLVRRNLEVTYLEEDGGGSISSSTSTLKRSNAGRGTDVPKRVGECRKSQGAMSSSVPGSRLTRLPSAPSVRGPQVAWI